MDPVYEFDAPRFVDFLRLADGEEDSDTDAWFDNRLEDDQFFPSRGTSEPTKTIPKKPARSAVSQEKPARVRVDDGSRSTCPSPPKQSKPSPDSTSPSSNTRSKIRQSVDDEAKHKAAELNSSKGGQRNKGLCMSGSKKPPARGLLHSSKISASASNLHKTSEELELEKISAMRAETARARKLAQESCKKALSSRSVVPKRCPKLVTMPEAFNFNTDSRLKKSNPAPASDKKIKDFASSLRDSKNTTKSHHILPTKPQPFKLSHSKSTASVTKFVSDAEKTANFSKQTPQRFRTVPKLNHKVLHRTNLGVPQVEPRPLTIPSEFALTKRRSMSTGDLREALQEAEEDHHRFQARPVNPKILQGPVGVKSVDPAAPTVPESPAFALRNRVRLHKEPIKQEEPQRILRASRVPLLGLAFKPKVEHKHTVPEPFQVEERSKEMLTRKQQKIEQLLEEEKRAHEFHASCQPSLSPDQLPPKQPRPATKPAPFELYVDKRGKEYQEQFQAKVG
ncbi:targeting protein for Xklp2 [Elysia marginata]|uniref:Targeting protein for Xklp2 n=1 Tax=Elysia marginata TaxID=1093978 RepID=A0AAV4EF57_9GAST|nr:targeting protein for Xklp2 [Elysia marginata]